MTRIQQGNMTRSRTTHDIQTQLCIEIAADVVLISEQYRTRDGPGWYSDDTDTAAIWIPDSRRLGHVTGDGSVWVRSGGVSYISVYLTPTEAIDEFETKLNGLEDTDKEMDSELIVAADFNIKAIEWGMEELDSRERRVIEMAARLDLVVLNTGCVTIFRRPGCMEIILDIPLTTSALAAHIHDWHMIDDYTVSDHQYIAFRVHDVAPIVAGRGPARWTLRKLDLAKLKTGRRSSWEDGRLQIGQE